MAKAFGGDQDAVPALLFRVRSRLCALPLAHVVETMRPLPVEPLAEAPAAVKGLTLIRGAPLPVMGLSSLLGDEDEECTRFVTVRIGERQVALAVASVLGISRIATASLRDLPPLLRGADHRAVAAIGTIDAELLFVLNAARLVPDGLLAALNNIGTSR